MSPKSSSRLALFAALLFVCADAAAYIGPGAGLSVLGSLWTVLVGIALALFAILTWPLRLLWRKMRRRSAPKTASDPDGDRDRA